MKYFAEAINYTDQAQYFPYNTFSSPYSNFKIVLYITNLWIRATSGPAITLTIDYSFLNDSFYILNATLQKNAFITNLHFSQIIYNVYDV